MTMIFKTFVRSLGLTTLALVVSLAVPAGSRANDATPSLVVEQLNQTLLQAMQEAEVLGFAGRYDLLVPVLADAFDYPFMARASVGGHWRDLNEDKRDALVDAFGRLSAATFASRFDGYGGEQFVVQGEEERPRQTVLVRNDLVKVDGSPVAIDFLLREKDGAWRIVDIYLESTYSELATKRSEYTSVIEREGFDKLIAAMEERIAALSR